MYTCPTHGIKHASYDCPRCEAEKRHEELVELHDRSVEKAQERHEEAVSAMRDAEYKRANPGDYKCPECFYFTLKRGAPRCPMCHAEVRSDYWPPIYAREQAQAEEAARRKRLAAEEWARGEPERQRRAKAEADEKERAARAIRQAEILGFFWKAYFGYLLPLLSFVTAAIIQGVELKFEEMIQGPFVIPVLNWIFMAIDCLAAIFSGSPEGATFWRCLVGWGLAGGIGYLLTSSRRPT